MATYTVAPLGVGGADFDGFASINAGVTDNDTIILTAGTFYEELILSDKTLTIEGQGPALTIIDGEDTRSTACTLNSITGSIEGIHFTRAVDYGLNLGSVTATDYTIVIRNCHASYCRVGTSQGDATGFQVWQATNAIAADITYDNCVAYGNGAVGFDCQRWQGTYRRSNCTAYSNGDLKAGGGFYTHPWRTTINDANWTNDSGNIWSRAKAAASDGFSGVYDVGNGDLLTIADPATTTPAAGECSFDATKVYVNLVLGGDPNNTDIQVSRSTVTIIDDNLVAYGNGGFDAEHGSGMQYDDLTANITATRLVAYDNQGNGLRTYNVYDATFTGVYVNNSGVGNEAASGNQRAAVAVAGHDIALRQVTARNSYVAYSASRAPTLTMENVVSNGCDVALLAQNASVMTLDYIWAFGHSTYESALTGSTITDTHVNQSGIDPQMDDNGRLESGSPLIGTAGNWWSTRPDDVDGYPFRDAPSFGAYEDSAKTFLPVAANNWSELAGYDLVGGDIVDGAGQTFVAKLIPPTDGSSTHQITWRNFSIDATGVNFGVSLNKNYQTFEDITSSNATSHGFNIASTGGNDITGLVLTRVTCDSNGVDGLRWLVASAADSRLTDCTITDCQFTNNGESGVFIAIQEGANANSKVTRLTMLRNTITGNALIGCRVMAARTATQTPPTAELIERGEDFEFAFNTSTGNGTVGGGVAGGGYQIGGFGSSTNAFGKVNIYGNIGSNNHGATGGMNVFYTQYARIHNNTCNSNRADVGLNDACGILIDFENDECEVYQNTCNDNTHANAAQVSSGCGLKTAANTNLKMWSNNCDGNYVGLAVAGDGIAQAAYTIDNNSFTNCITRGLWIDANHDIDNSLTLRNNVFTGAAGATVGMEDEATITWVNTHNAVFGFTTGFHASVTAGTGTVTADPLLDPNGRPKAGSPLQAAGVKWWDSGSTELGSELVPNGEFGTDTTGWTAFFSTLQAVGNVLLVTNNTESGQGGAISDVITTTIGSTYQYSVFAAGGTTGGWSIVIGDSTTEYVRETGSAETTLQGQFVADDVDLQIVLAVNSTTDTHFAIFDKVSIKEVTTIANPIACPIDADGTVFPLRDAGTVPDIGAYVCKAGGVKVGVTKVCAVPVVAKVKAV